MRGRQRRSLRVLFFEETKVNFAARSCRLPFARLPALLLGLAVGACDDPSVLTADMPLHLEDHLDAAVVEGSELPVDPPASVEWRFDEPQDEWNATPQLTIGSARLRPVEFPPERTADALRVMLPESSRLANNQLGAGIYVDLPGWRPEDGGLIVVRARTTSVTSMGVGLNVAADTTRAMFGRTGGATPIVSDGSVQTYQIRLDWGTARARPWQRLGLGFRADEPGSIDILSVSVVPVGAMYDEVQYGVRPVTLGERIRRTLFTHAPGRFSYLVRVPEGGRLDAALGVLSAEDSVTFRVTVRAGREQATIFEERYADAEQWTQRSVDLSKFAGQTVTLTLEAQGVEPGTVALWGAPTVSGVRISDKPNVIFYVIDGGGADQMSVYGYNRRTTPSLERLAAQGAVFEYAYSNSGDTRLSTPSFMTSLQFSVLGAPDPFESLPAQARTMAERFHEARYSTAVFTSNPNAGTISSLERGVDVFRDVETMVNWRSSPELHDDFWEWRQDFPGEPYWVHFQTTDVHGPSNQAPGQFVGLFSAPEDRARLGQWDATLRAWRGRNPGEWDWRRKQFTETGIDRVQYYNLARSFYDERLAHQDHQLGRFVERLQQTGQWENTLLVIAADHSIESATNDFLVPLADPEPPRELWTVLRSSVSRVPLLFIWPGHITGGQRFSHAVSMIDVLPTLLDLAGLPVAEAQQGQSLAPLLLGQAGWQPRPVIFDEFSKDPRTGELRGTIEMIDGRWGASLWIGAPEDPLHHRPTPLLLFDVWNDPLALAPLNEERPDLVAKYTRLLNEQWAAHRLLARRFTTGGQMELTPAQLETLRSLGYIR